MDVAIRHTAACVRIWNRVFSRGTGHQPGAIGARARAALRGAPSA
jgi:hypothetical protein